MRSRCRRTTEPHRDTLSMRTRSSVENLPALFGHVYEKVARHLDSLQEAPAGPPFAAYYNLDVSDLDVEIGFAVGRPLAGQGDIIPGVIAACEAASVIHMGPYDQMGSSYEILMTWMEERDLQPTGIAYEYYLDDPAETPPAELRTRIVFPLMQSATLEAP